MKKGNLLIVEDEPILLQGLHFKLKELTDNTFLANDGVEALAILEKEEVNCVVCDINMPRMNGVEVIKRIRDSGNDIPFIFYTGHGNRDLMLEVAKYGAFDFLEKPSFEGLEEVVANGLKVGTNPAAQMDHTHDAFISEYKKLIGLLE